MRTFVAIELDEDCRRALAGAVQALEPLAGGVRWVKPESLHATLKFIGELEETALPDAIACIQGAAEPIAPFQVRVSGLSGFPPRGTPRVIHAPMEENSGALQQLHDRVEDALARELGVEKENRRYLPHVTLGRVKNRRRCPEMSEIAGAVDDFEFGSFTVDSFVLMKSDLTPEGAIYSVLHRFPLG